MSINKIAIRREDLSKKGEKRVAVTPSLAKEIAKSGANLKVQGQIHPESKEVKRAFEDEEYVEVGAQITEDISDAELIFGLKEIDINNILPKKTYLFFSHTHKGQVKNREMLRTLVERKCTFIDYELIANEKGRVITAFTYFAGYAGMIDTLWTLGKRWNYKGIENVFEQIPQSIEKEDLPLIKNIIREVGEEISKNGTPENRPPVVNLILGAGKTSQGSQEIFNLLPVKQIGLKDLQSVFETGDRHFVYQCILDIEELFRLKADSSMSKAVYEAWSNYDKQQLYFEDPDQFESNLDQSLPYATILMNCTLWSPKYPRVLSRDLMTSIWKTGTPLEVIGDITCDPEGSIQFSQETWIDEPVYIYHPINQKSNFGFDGEGIAVMAVTNLPCEFSADASSQFSDDLRPILSNLLQANFEGSFEESTLNEEFKGACILWKGEFTEKYGYMKAYLED